MPVFADSNRLYACMHAFLDRVAQEPGAGDAILASRLVIRLRCTEPEAECTLDGRRRPLQIVYGPSPLRPTLDIEMAADTLHRILMDELSLKKALAERQLRVEGPAWKVLALADLFYRGQAIYPEMLCAQGPASDPPTEGRR
jgi:3-methyladenine DNA glycosylase Mpg